MIHFDPQPKNDNPRKTRLVTIYKDEVFKEVDGITYKYINSQPRDMKRDDTVASDIADALDGTLLSRDIAFRDAQVRRKIQHSLLPEHLHESNDIPEERPSFKYYLWVPIEFNDNTLNAVKEYLHRFLVYGTLYDWYLRLGIMDQANALAPQLDELENDLDGMLRTPSRQTTPLQPFGPAKRYGKMPWKI